MHWQQGGEMLVVKSCIASLEPIPIVEGVLVHFFCILSFAGKLLLSLIGLTSFWNRPDQFGETGLTDLCSVLAHVQGQYAYVQGDLEYALAGYALLLSLFFAWLCRAIVLA
jgi:hypothetical protein